MTEPTDTPTAGPTDTPGRKGRALCLNSGGLDSQLAICVLRSQGVEVEAVTFASPFFSPDNAVAAAQALDVPIHVIDFTDDLVPLLKAPPHGFGSAMNPCIDCHAAMIRRAAILLETRGFDCIATGEVLGQRPMSQRRQALDVVMKSADVGDRLLRPLSALLLPETEPERLGLVDRSRLLGLSGRTRKPQIALARQYGIQAYPTPAGGCKLTESRYAERLRNIKDHEGLDDRRLLDLLAYGRHFRLPGGTFAVVGRNKADNAAIRPAMRGPDVLFRPVNVPGATLLAIHPAPADIPDLRRLCAAFADHKGVDTIVVSEMHAASKPVQHAIPACSRDAFLEFMI